jgi:hypothetical protein
VQVGQAEREAQAVQVVPAAQAERVAQVVMPA